MISSFIVGYKLLPRQHGRGMDQGGPGGANGWPELMQLGGIFRLGLM